MDATLTETEGQRPAIKNESENGLQNEAGTVAMARTRVPDSATSQFFINVKDNAFLNREQAADGVGYAVFGKVVDGMDVVKKIEVVPTTTKGMHQDVPVEAVVLKSVKIAGVAAMDGGADTDPSGPAADSPTED
jgi:cyclophilin family peptidyl-prolyl cis-trans isomerase